MDGGTDTREAHGELDPTLGHAHVHRLDHRFCHHLAAGTDRERELVEC